MAVILQKDYPLNYSKDITNIIDMMAFTNNILVLGSSSLKTQKYASDYDGYEDVNMSSINDIVKKFKSIVSNLMKQPNTFITDIKCGTLDLFKVVPDDMTPKNYKQLKPVMIQKLKTMCKDKIINQTELQESLSYLKKKTIDLYDVEVIKKEIRYNILRWKPEDILKGKMKYRGYDISLKFALQTPIFSKIDVVSWVENNRYTDFSIIYVFSVKGKIINKGLDDFITIVKKNIIVLLHDKNYFKVAKRIFALTRYIKPIDLKTLNILSKLFNSDLGIIYQVKGDIGTIESILNKKGIKKTLKIEIEQMVNRLSHVVVPAYLDKEYNIICEINKLIQNPYNVKLIEQLQEQLDVILNNETFKYLHCNKLHPIPAKYLLSEGDGMVIAKKDLIKEHNELIPILKKGTKKQQLQEALKQEQELIKLQQEKGGSRNSGYITKLIGEKKIKLTKMKTEPSAWLVENYGVEQNNSVKIAELEKDLDNYRSGYNVETFYVGKRINPVSKRHAQSTFKLYNKVKTELEDLTGKKYPELPTLSELQKINIKTKKEFKKIDEKNALLERIKMKEGVKKEDKDDTDLFLANLKKKKKNFSFLTEMNKEKGDGIKDILKKGFKGVIKVANRITKVLPKSDENARDGWDDEKHGVLLLPNGKYGRANYMGPGTHLLERLKRGDPPRTAMDELSMYHDIRYSLAKSQADIEKADEIFISGAKYILKKKMDKAINVNLGLRPIQLKYQAEKRSIIKPIAEIEEHSPAVRKYLESKLDTHPIGYGLLKPHEFFLD